MFGVVHKWGTTINIIHAEGVALGQIDGLHHDAGRDDLPIGKSLPAVNLGHFPASAEGAERLASELAREALRQYERKNWWDELNAYGRRSAEAPGVESEEDVVRAIRVARRRK